MFSYAPCLIKENGANGFARPVINLPEIISPTLNQGLKITETQDVKNAWKKVAEQVLNSKLSLMVENILPIHS